MAEQIAQRLQAAQIVPPPRSGRDSTPGRLFAYVHCILLDVGLVPDTSLSPIGLPPSFAAEGEHVTLRYRHPVSNAGYQLTLMLWGPTNVALAFASDAATAAAEAREKDRLDNPSGARGRGGGGVRSVGGKMARPEGMANFGLNSHKYCKTDDERADDADWGFVNFAALRESVERHVALPVLGERGFEEAKESGPWRPASLLSRALVNPVVVLGVVGAVVSGAAFAAVLLARGRRRAD